MRLVLFDNRVADHSLGFRHEHAKRKADRRVLIVDDNRDTALTLAAVLRAMGYSTVAVAHDGRSALQIACEQKSQVVFIDLVMPDMDGFDLAHRLRGIDPAGDVRLIALTGFSDEVFVRYAKDAKFDALVVKPPSDGELERVLEA